MENVEKYRIRDIVESILEPVDEIKAEGEMTEFEESELTAFMSVILSIQSTYNDIDPKEILVDFVAEKRIL